MLEISNLTVTVPSSDGARPVVQGLSLTVPQGELHVLLGPNGSGKSSLLAAIMGLDPYKVTDGDIRFNGESLLGLSPDDRAAKGIGMGFQRPPTIEGVTVAGFATAIGAGDMLAREAAALDLTDFSSRSLNAGFSGGEVKRWEILKLFLQNPAFALFDEPESGVDVEHVTAVGGAVDRLMKTPSPQGARSGLVITHTGLILDHVTPALAHVMQDGRIIKSGPAREVFGRIQSHGYTA
ncbi:MAG: ABC transporter ATP-binding protein [Rhodobacterales bacterium]|nr:MAG: ABC transporter ATP-binding protein [Rhodobacterales bacterium]